MRTLADGSQLPMELFAFPVRAVHVSPTVMRKLAGLQSVDFTVAVALMRFPATFRCIDHDVDVDDDDYDDGPLTAITGFLPLIGCCPRWNPGSWQSGVCNGFWMGATIMAFFLAVVTLSMKKHLGLPEELASNWQWFLVAGIILKLSEKNSK